MPILELKNVSYAYERGKAVLQSVNAELETGKMHAVLAFGLSYFASNAVAGQIGNHLLEQSAQVEKEDNSGAAAATAVEVGADTIIQKPLPTENGIQVSVGLDSLVLLYLIGFSIIIVAVSASSITVMRLKPREILSKMS